MNAYGIYKSLWMVIGLVMIVIAGWVTCLYITCREINRELTFRHEYGDAWQAEFEKGFGAISEAHTRIVLGVLGMIIIPILVYSLLRALRPEWQKNRRKKTSTAPAA